MSENILEKIIKKKIEIANQLSKDLKNLPGLEIPKIKKGRTHVFYSYAMKINDKITKVHRDQIWRMLIKEGIPVNNNIPCIHRLPIFKKKIAFGKKKFPWSLNKKYKNLYNEGTLPVAEKLSDSQILCLQMWAFDYSVKDVKKIIKIFFKVWRKLKLI